MKEENAREIIEGLYAGRRVFHGELHDHAATGGTSDGKYPLDVWRREMAELGMDFAAIIDHRQVRHMYLPEWEDGLFIGGSEPGTGITDSKAENKSLHYNMIFADSPPLEELLTEFAEFGFEGGPEGHFGYPTFTRERFCELIDTVKAKGGFFVHPPPKQVMVSDDPLDYWFRDETGIEVFYNEPESKYTAANYELWLQLLAAGKRVWACAGGDKHLHPGVEALTAIYSEERKNAAFIRHLRAGDFTCGGVGMRMCVGDVLMGGVAPFKDKALILAVGDFHRSLINASHEYRLDLFADEDIIVSREIPPYKTAYLALYDLDADRAYYRAEVTDVTRDLRIAIGNPIWNADKI